MTDKLQIVIIDDHPLFRAGVATSLRAEPDIEVVGEGASAGEALKLSAELLPDLLLLDINIPGGGLQAVPRIAATCPVTKIVMLTASEEEDDVVAALKAGARGYVLKGVSARELIGILRAVHAGESYVTPTLAAALLAELTGAAARPPATNPFSELSERERQILELVAEGCSNKEIGAKLFLAEKTIKHYMTNVLQKLHVRNRVEAALLAQKSEK
ncbi:MAG TPA: response regulator transcription factor [Anaerolineae bacterium]|nr:response regulator transcription factor [Anaerolineae bacterium]